MFLPRKFSEEKQAVYYFHISNRKVQGHQFKLSRLMVVHVLTISKQKAVDTVAKINNSLLPVSWSNLKQKG